MSRFLILLAVLLSLGLRAAAQPAPSAGQRLSALARAEPARSSLSQSGQTVTLDLGLSQGVPYRVFTLDRPRRLVLDFYEVDWGDMDAAGLGVAATPAVSDLRVGVVRPGWSRMVIDLAQPMKVQQAGLRTGLVHGALLQLRLTPVSPEAFARTAGAPREAMLRPPPGPPAGSPPARRRHRAPGAPLVVVLDPGHGGIDPGARNRDVAEAALMLTFARELKEELLRACGFRVVMTREDNVFVPLETRVSIARNAGADLFLSLHADALVQGRASGATVYTLSDTASDRASQILAERHDRMDLLAGVDLRGQDDIVARTLMDLARTETQPRSEKLAEALVRALERRIRLRRRAHLHAGFSVLKAPDIPSVLLEIGFLSSPRDFRNLTDPTWRARAARAIREGIQDWAQEDARDAPLLRH